MDKSQKHAQRKKPAAKDHLLYESIYMKIPEETTWALMAQL
jgi:hypothetical protein